MDRYIETAAEARQFRDPKEERGILRDTSKGSGLQSDILFIEDDNLHIRDLDWTLDLQSQLRSHVSLNTLEQLTSECGFYMLLHEEVYLINADERGARGRSHSGKSAVTYMLEGYWDLLDVVLDVKARCCRQRDISGIEMVAEDDLTILCSSLQRLRVTIIRYWGLMMLALIDVDGNIEIGYLVRFLLDIGLPEFRFETDNPSPPSRFARLIAVDVNGDEILWEMANLDDSGEEDARWALVTELNEREREACTLSAMIFGPAVVQDAEDDGESVGYDYWADTVEPISATPPDPAPSQSTTATTYLSRITATVRYYPFS
jgi:hypothetical protein